ncbi:hypothetical protein ASPACDRAFT_47466 [Aspergillus aculeatus ATCC 16872]|uniref:Uncharacterized protein n=1 Tax=Aspergillus aculeatus (strain ATCC 16872 / CBS 172.66 / WB 5094) TaxID=690307 RepID=A0A1L9WHI9_ASPA1|nr:uncharacterized protein ASPACDRAFT_47466 [Aspergillus aculeatus ATCC 16872]OJJ95577.1 hypothetical protein ASPACDRAFT_47466 [Aspergillus aculeatus ATCC 16872]
MLVKLRAKPCCSQADGDADEVKPAAYLAISAASAIDPEPTSKISSNEAIAPSVSGATVQQPRGLSQVAFDSLDPERKRWLSTEQSPDRMIEKVISDTKEKYPEFRNKSLSIRRRDGREIKVRDIAQQILPSALNAQEIVKSVVAFDPTGHAINRIDYLRDRLVGVMTKNYIKRKDAILEASEYLAEQLAYFTVLDK